MHRQFSKAKLQKPFQKFIAKYECLMQGGMHFNMFNLLLAGASTSHSAQGLRRQKTGLPGTDEARREDYRGGESAARGQKAGGMRHK